MLNLLKQIGLTGNESRIYLDLLELGSVTTKDIIAKTNLSRGQVYDCLASLAEKGLVSHVIQTRTKYFEAVPPARLKNIIEDKKNKLEAYKLELDKIIPRLEKKRKLSHEKQEVFLYKGPGGLKTLFEDCLEKKTNIYAIGGYQEDAVTINEFLPKFLPDFHRRRIERGIKFIFIFPKGSIRRAKQVKELPLTEVRILPTEFGSIGATQIRGDKVDTILWGSQPLGTTIRSKEIAEHYKKYFDFLWKLSKPL